ncbi:MAG TPA: helix-turn-helix domain-containing protein [Bacilli bacterium]
MNEFYRLMEKAKQGDQEATLAIIEKFAPLIRKTKNKADPQDRDDLEQELVEKMISIIHSYNLDNVPTFSEFCRAVLEKAEKNHPDPHCTNANGRSGGHSPFQ